MPLYVYKAKEVAQACPYCVNGFEQLEALGGAPMLRCPRCGSPVEKQWTAPRVGRSASGFDDRARGAGFHKLKKTGTGEYEREY
jgi:predicted nucleic acid-binding Zn ribbon protein